MSSPQANNPLHGVTLEQILTQLQQHYGWAGLAQRVNVRCFANDPTIKSSLTFLRRTPWARTQIEALYLALAAQKAREAAADTRPRLFSGRK